MEFGREGMDTMEFLDFTDAGAVVEYERFIQDSKGDVYKRQGQQNTRDSRKLSYP